MSATSSSMFLNLFRIFHLLMLLSVTSAAVERVNAALMMVKTVMRSTTHLDRLSALVLLRLHKDIKLDIQAIIDKHKWKLPRRLFFINP